MELLNATKHMQYQDTPLRVGLFPFSPEFNDAISVFAAEHPNVSLLPKAILAEDWLLELSHVADGSMDVLEFASKKIAQDMNLQFMPLKKVPCVCAVTVTDVLARKESVSLDDLSGRKVGIHSRHCVDGLQEACRQADIELIDASEGRKSAFNICASGGAFLLALNAASHYEPLVCKPLLGGYSWLFGCVYHKNADQRVKRLLDYLKRRYSSSAMTH